MRRNCTLYLVVYDCEYYAPWEAFRGTYATLPLEQHSSWTDDVIKGAVFPRRSESPRQSRRYLFTWKWYTLLTRRDTSQPPNLGLSRPTITTASRALSCVTTSWQPIFLMVMTSKLIFFSLEDEIIVQWVEKKNPLFCTKFLTKVLKITKNSKNSNWYQTWTNSRNFISSFFKYYLLINIR